MAGGGHREGIFLWLFIRYCLSLQAGFGAATPTCRYVFPKRTAFGNWMNHKNRA